MRTARIQRLKNKFQSIGCDAFLVSNFYNILYLTGFKTLSPDEREAFVVVTERTVYIISDRRYLHNNKTVRVNGEKFAYKIISHENNTIRILQEIIKTEKIGRLAVEGEDLKVAEFERFKEKLPAVKLILTTQIIKQMRTVKDRKEISCIQKACKIADQCMAHIKTVIKKGATEREIAFKIEAWLRNKGYDSAFDPLVAIDKNTALPHHNTKEGRGKVKEKSVILVDFGAQYQNYYSDITRMFFYGKPHDEVLWHYTNLLDIQEKTIQTLKHTNNSQEADRSCRSLFTEKNLPLFPHSVGHGVGLEIHEYPRISEKVNETLEENEVFTIEPGIYIPEKWGMRIEDVVWYKGKETVVLTRFQKKPIFLS